MEKTPEDAFRQFAKVQQQAEDVDAMLIKLEADCKILRNRRNEISGLATKLSIEAENIIIEFIKLGKRSRQQLIEGGMPPDTADEYISKAANK